MSSGTIDPFSVINGIMLTALTVELVQHAYEVEWLLLIYEGRCPVCRYRIDHPIAKHGSVPIGKECGWR